MGKSGISTTACFAFSDMVIPNRASCYEELTQSAIALIDETEPYNVFISYKRSESSALALLVLARLKEHDLIPFVDMALEAGGNWHADLEDRIRACDYFIVLLGENTLSSPMTVKEIGWALDAKRTIIPIWHSGFDIKSHKWAEDACRRQGRDSTDKRHSRHRRKRERIQYGHRRIVESLRNHAIITLIARLWRRFSGDPPGRPYR